MIWLRESMSSNSVRWRRSCSRLRLLKISSVKSPCLTRSNSCQIMRSAERQVCESRGTMTMPMKPASLNDSPPIMAPITRRPTMRRSK